MLTIGSVFSGIGGLELGLERAGVGRTVWQCECDEFALRVLARHWPEARRFTDVRALDAATPAVDVMCGGFPCQDVSNAGKRAGLAGERSGLFFEFMRAVRLLRPRFLVLENVSALLARGLGAVLGELAACGFDAEWDCIPASAVGAPHQRDRVFILGFARVADPASDDESHQRGLNDEGRSLVGAESGASGGTERRDTSSGSVVDRRDLIPEGATSLADAGRTERRARAAAGDDADGQDAGRPQEAGRATKRRALPGAGGGDGMGAVVLADAARHVEGRPEQRAVGERAGARGEPLAPADAVRGRRRGRRDEPEPEHGRGDAAVVGAARAAADADLVGRDGRPRTCRVDAGWRQPPLGGRWEPEPDVGRVAHGVPARVERLRALGNAVVPQVAEVVGRALLAFALEKGLLSPTEAAAVRGEGAA